ncbi:MAG: hypothetical protein HYX94_05325 [Chloroflexi bacterium]|nr:hypothetical protein [Chloroflexota bacterium]
MFVSLSRESLAKLGGTEHLLGLAKLAAQKLNCCYGYIWTAADYWFARAGARGVGLQIGQTRMSDWETERTSAWSAGRKRCDRLVRDVYWASFLGPGHLEIIRPLDELQQSGLIASFEALGDGRYLVLVTRELDEFLTPSGQARAEKLREALSPIIARRSPPPKNLLVPPSYLTGEAGEENLGRIRRMADHAISDLKEDLNINLDWTEESLAILDRALTPEYLRHIAELDRQKEFTPEDWRSLHMVLVGAIGSYLGEMVLKHIGGKWLPRDPYFYSTISFGPREYDPYAMAEKRLADCEGELLLPHFRWIRERETK